jgi:hypothetical protein
MAILLRSPIGRSAMNRVSLGGEPGVVIPQLITIVNTNTASSNNDFNIAYPSGGSSGDTCYLFVTAGNALLTSITSGWTQISSNTASSLVRGYIYRHVIAGGDTDPVNVQFDKVTGHGALFIITAGVDAGTPEDIAVINQGHDFSSTVPGTSISPVTDSAALFSFARRGNNGQPPAIVVSNNFSPVVAGFSCGSNAAMTVATRNPVLADTYTTPSWNFESGFSAVDHVALRPA